MNRLILIGNGFDLAHGLKTSYHDFILDYLKGCVVAAIEDESNSLTTYNNNNVLGYSDDLIEVFVSKKYKRSFPSDSFSNFLNIPKLVDEIKSAKSITNILNLTNKAVIIIKYINDFPQSLLNEYITKNWVDIEGLYYAELKKHLKQYNRDKDQYGVAEIVDLKNLNKQLDFIKDKLKEYLTKIQSKGFDRINEIDRLIYYSLDTQEAADKILFLNFNYTYFAEKYATAADLINIHGQLSDVANEVIFGYGDEIDKHYNEIEDLNENEFFKHIKSFDYFKTSNYENLLRFINADKFQIFIMGHSCGLSDRTMLNTIFEHENCDKIKIFYYTKDEYRTKTYEISRHFNNKASMRRKIVPFPECIPMPQHNDNQS